MKEFKLVSLDWGYNAIRFSDVDSISLATWVKLQENTRKVINKVSSFLCFVAKPEIRI